MAYHNEGPTIIGTVLMLIILGLVPVLARVYVRTRIKYAFGWDDGLIIVAWASASSFLHPLDPFSLSINNIRTDIVLRYTLRCIPHRLCIAWLRRRSGDLDGSSKVTGHFVAFCRSHHGHLRIGSRQSIGCHIVDEDLPPADSACIFVVHHRHVTRGFLRRGDSKHRSL